MFTAVLCSGAANVNIHPRRGVWGNRVSPCPRPREGAGGLRPQGCGARGLPQTPPAGRCGRAAPAGVRSKGVAPRPLRTGCALTFPGARAWGTWFPHAPGAYVHVRRGALREPPGGRSWGRRRRGGETPPLRRPASRQGLRPPDPPTGWGNGETRFPHFPYRAGLARPHPPAGGGAGEPGFPIPLRAGLARPHPPAGGGAGEPGFPIPLRTGCALTFPGARALGNLVPPCSR